MIENIEGASFIFTHDDVYYIARWYKKLCTLSTTSSSCARFRVFFIYLLFFLCVYTRRPCVKFFKMLISENAREARSPGNKKIITPRRRYFNPFFRSKTNTKGGCTPVRGRSIIDSNWPADNDICTECPPPASRSSTHTAHTRGGGV